MTRTFKRYFVPHPENDHRPYFLRTEMAFGLIAIAVIGQVLFLGQYWQVGGRSLMGDISTSVLVSQSNAQRVEQGLGGLTVNPILVRAAQAKASDMAAKGYFAHQSPDGSQPWDWIRSAGYVYRVAGENLAVNFVDSSDVTSAWMASPAHRANILSPKYTEIGIATAVGTYKGREAVYVVQMFGTPATFAPVAKAAELETPTVQPPAPKHATVPQKVAAAVKPKVLPQATVAAPAASTTAPAAVSSTEPLAMTPLPIAVAQAQAPEQTSVPLPTKRSLQFFYALLATLVALAVLLKVFVKAHIRHPRLILNGIGVLVVITGLAWITEYVTLARALIG